MTLLFYYGRTLIKYAFLICLPFLIMPWLNFFSALDVRSTNTLGEPLGFVDKLAISLGQASPLGLDFLIVAFMLAAIVVLFMMGRRAEIHIVRGAGQSNTQILFRFSLISALIIFISLFTLEPLAHEFSNWANQKLDPLKKEQSARLQEGRIAWFFAENGSIQGRLTGFDPTTGVALSGLITDFGTRELPDSFRYLSQIEVSELTLTGVQEDLSGSSTPVRLNLDANLTLVPIQAPNINLPLPHLLGWIEDPDLWTLNPRQKSYAIHSNLAKPLITAALVLIAGSLSVGMGTRQPISRLIFSSLAVTAFAYSLFLVTNAFGVNGKLPAMLGAWGLALFFLFAGSFMLSWQELSWSFGRNMRRSEVQGSKIRGAQ